jgi:hypothetical protein
VINFTWRFSLRLGVYHGRFQQGAAGVRIPETVRTAAVGFAVLLAVQAIVVAGMWQPRCAFR